MSSLHVGAFEAKTHFSELLEKVRQGTEVVVTRRGKPIARIVAYDEPRPAPVFGRLKGKIRIADDFDAPLADMAEYMR